MKRISRAAIAGLMAIVLVVPATTASAQVCGSMRGVAQLEIFDTPTDGLIGQGSAFVVFNGNFQYVTFDETSFVATGPGSNDITHVWHFDEGDATFLEHSTPTPIGTSSLLRFRSPVDVSPSGTARYNGVFDTSSQTGWFTVRGNICVGS